MGRPKARQARINREIATAKDIIAGSRVTTWATDARGLGLTEGERALFDAGLKLGVEDGRKEALADLDAACERLADGDEYESITAWRIAPGQWRAEVVTRSINRTGQGQTATAALLDIEAEREDGGNG